MSIPVPITAQEIKKIGRELNKKKDFVCLDEASRIKTLLVAQHRLMTGKRVAAEIIKGYK